MAKKPKLVVSNESPEPEPIGELTALDHALRIVGERNAEPDDTHLSEMEEAALIVEEQWLPPEKRAFNRWQRKANEDLCQAIERDERFIAAMKKAKHES